MGVRLAGFVIHGNNRQTLGACLDGLKSVCDEVLALDSQSSDGSVELVRAAGVRSESRPWRGFGAARAEAVRLLSGSEYVFYLDSDEWLEPAACDVIRAWKTEAPTREFYRLQRRDWVTLNGRKFLYRHEHKRRLIRRDKAVWTDAMIVHESLPKGLAGTVDAYVEHAFVDDLAVLGPKTRRYALLWALQTHVAQKSTPTVLAPAFLLRIAHLVRDGLLKGAFVRGGSAAWQVALSVADYHVWKYRYLRAIERGEFAEEVARLKADVK